MFTNTMQCELCGSIIRGKPKIVHIEGAELRVCPQCARYGTEVHRPHVTGSQAKRMAPGSTPAPRRRGRDVFDLMVGEIVNDYSDRIRQARMAKGWEQKELALRIKEREILIKKIEKGDLIPEDNVRKKLEQVLEIKLLDTAADDLNTGGGQKITTTLGDVMKIKKSGK